MSIEPPSKTVFRRGFTLVELLVTITIIAVLAGLSVFGVSRMRSAANNSNCVSNLRQLAIAGQSYATETGVYPTYGRQANGGNAFWFHTLQKDLGMMEQPNAAVTERDPSFPTCKECLRKHNAQSEPRNNPIRTYSINVGISKPQQDSSGVFTFPGIRTGQVANPSKTSFFMDGTKGPGGMIYWDSIGRPNEIRRAENLVHGGKINIAFIDGHVESRSLAEIPAQFSRAFWNPSADF